MPTPRRRDDPPDVDYAALRRAEREEHEHERASAEAPTRETHIGPCATLLAHIQTLASVSMRVGVMLGIVGTASAIVVSAAIWLMARSDAGDEASRARDAELTKAGNERNVAIATLTTEVRVELTAIKSSQTRVEAMLANIYRVTPPAP